MVSQVVRRVIIFCFKHESADFKNRSFLRENQFKKIEAEVKHESLRVPETKWAALLRALVVSGSPKKQ